MNGCGCAPICLFTKAGDWLTAGVRQAHAELFSCRAIAVVVYGCESWTERRQSAKELMLLNCGVGEDSLGPKGDQTSQS